MNIHYSSSSSSSSSSTSSVPMHKKRKWSKEQLLRNLEILGDLSAPLPPDLPPSPPASPRPHFKRKLDSSASSLDTAKRPRTSDRIHSLQPPPPSSRLHRHEPTEDGEVCEAELPTNTLARYSSSSSIPIRRPKRGRPHNREFDEIHDKYHQFGRMLKYSGDARFWSTYPSSHKEYRPLPNPPPPNSSYHKFGGLIARLELIDALICFTYSIWSKDFSRKACFKETWTTIEAFLSWCKHKWGSDDTVGEREKAFVGLIWMIEAFIHGRKLVYSSRNQVDPQLDLMMKECKAKMELAMKESEVENAPASLLSTKTQTPQMLPSPASLVTNSANSTPTGRPDGTPNTVSSGSSSTHSSLSATARPSAQPHPQPTSSSFQPIPAYMFPQGPNNTYLVPPIDSASYAAAAAVVTPVYPPFLCTLKELSNSITASAWCMSLSQTTLSLPILRAHFPRTYARIVGNESMRVEEEYEGDIEDEEGELCWPGQCVTGEGLGWVCMMGKAMIGELGREVGYRGLEGVVPKPKPEEEASGQGGSGPAQVKVEAQR